MESKSKLYNKNIRPSRIIYEHSEHESDNQSRDDSSSQIIPKSPYEPSDYTDNQSLQS